MMKRFICFSLLIVLTFPIFAYRIRVVPMPREYDFINSYYVEFNKRSKFSAYDKELNPLAKRWALFYEMLMDKKLWKTHFAKRHIEVSLDPYMDSPNVQSYYIYAHDNWVEIHANTEIGVYYGLQTLSQLWDVITRGDDIIWRVPLLFIDDEPYCSNRAVSIKEEEWMSFSMGQQDSLVRRFGHLKYNYLVIKHNSKNGYFNQNLVSDSIQSSLAENYMNVIDVSNSDDLKLKDPALKNIILFDSFYQVNSHIIQRDSILYAIPYNDNLHSFATYLWCFPALR